MDPCIRGRSLTAATGTAVRMQSSAESSRSVDQQSSPAEADRIPEYVRGNGNYQWILNDSDAANGIGHLGANVRLRLAMEKLKRGEYALQ